MKLEQKAALEAALEAAQQAALEAAQREELKQEQPPQGKGIKPAGPIKTEGQNILKNAKTDPAHSSQSEDKLVTDRKTKEQVPTPENKIREVLADLHKDLTTERAINVVKSRLGKDKTIAVDVKLIEEVVTKEKAPKVPPPPPPPPGGFPSVPPFPEGSPGKVITESSESEDQTAKHLKAIRGGIKLKKAVTNDRSAVNLKGDSQTSEIQQHKETAKKFMPAALYLSNGAWGTYKDKLKAMVIESGGKETSNKYLNTLMEKHAKYAKKTGKVDAVAGDRDADGKVKKSGTVSKTEYEGYILGREQTNDRNNDFKQNIDQYLDIYLEELSLVASEQKSSLKSKMQEWFAIATVVQTPQTFFVENGDLNKQLVKTGCQVQWLTSGDITEDFIDGLIHYDDTPEKIDPILDDIFAREKKKFQDKGEALDNAKKKHKSKLSRLLGKK